MRKSVEKVKAGESGIVDLARFGFDAGDDAWMRAFRAAAAQEPLGELGPFDLLEELGRGGQGVVYRALRRADGRRFAVKRLVRGAGATVEDRRRLDRELRAIRMLDHSGIARAHGIEEVDGQPVIMMEYIDGARLVDWARPGSARRDVPAIAAAFVALCDAVHHAHIRGIIHRDLKPTNVLVVDSGDSGAPRPVVLDFGMARIDDAVGQRDSLSGGRLVGTLAYAAPEQFDGVGDCDATDARADVYSIGAMLYEALTGKPPVDTDGPLARSIRAIAEFQPTAPSRIADGIPRDLDAIALKALAKDKRERYQSVEEMGEDLRRLLTGDPVLARPPRTPYLVGKLLRRHPIGFSMAAVGVVGMTILAGLLYASRENERASREKANATAAFLMETLAAADPARGGADVTVVEVLEQAGKQIGPAMGDRPAVAAAAYLSIGTTYNNLWKWNEAMPHLEKAVELLREADDGDSSELARALCAYGRALTSLRDARAIDVQREALDLRTAIYGERHVEVAESWKELAYALQQALDPPDFDEAERCYERALTVYRATVGEDDRETAGCLHSFGWMRVRQHRLLDAEALYHEALEIFRRTDRRDDPFYVECLYGYTAQLAKLGRDAENVAALDELIPLLRASHGSRSLLPPLEMRARVLRNLARYDEAMDAHAQVLSALLEKLEVDSDLLGPFGAHPGSGAGEHAADLLCDRLLDAAGEIPAASIGSALSAACELADLHVVAGRIDRAEAIYDRIDAVIEANGPGLPVIESEVLAGSAAIVEAYGQSDEAIGLLEDAIAVLEGAENIACGPVAKLRLRLSKLQATLGDVVAAKETLSGIVDDLLAQYGPDHRLTREVVDRELTLEK